MSRINVQPNTAVQIKVLWGENPIFVTELTPPRDFSIGEDDCDFTVPREQIGSARVRLLTVDAGTLRVAVPRDASVVMERDGKVDVADASVLEQAPSVVLQHGSTARVTRGQLTYEVTAGAPEEGVARAFSDGEMSSVASYFGASFLSVGALLAATAFMVPNSGLTDGESIRPEQLVAIQQYLDATAEKEEEPKSRDDASAESSESGGNGAQAEGDEGKMGSKDSSATNKRWQKKGPRDNPDPELSRLEAARNFGMVGLLSGGALGDPDAPTAIFGRDHAIGADDISAKGNMWGEDIGEAAGTGGLGLIDFGRGGGGKYRGIGLGDIETIGHGSGTCKGSDCGNFGRDHGRVQADRTPKDITLRTAPPQVSGRIPAESIQRRVRQNFGRLRLCYEKGLMQNPNLQGRVAVRFLISSDGAVAMAQNGGSSLPSSEVTNCVVQSFYGISFPKPDTGSVSVTYPIMFSPG